eukprot:8144447-Pyramimonas_sp.AAC.1
MASILFQQRWFIKFDTLTCTLIDSSPQLGYNFLRIIEDTIKIPAAHSFDIMLRIGMDLTEHYTTMICPMSSIGSGK